MRITMHKRHIISVALAVLIALSSWAVIPASRADAATDEEIEQSIEAGLARLATQQNVDGSWGTSARVSRTGLAVLAFEINATAMGMSPLDPDYTYRQVVEDGLNYIFTQLEPVTILVQPAGDPDTNANGIGVRAMAWDSFHYIYEAACALMAIAASNEPSMIVPVGVGSQAGRSFADVAQDMVDYFAWGQNEGGSARGGWGYLENYSTSWSDNSNAGYATMALGFAAAPAPYGMGLTIPAFVFTEMAYWVAFIQNTDGGSGYEAPSNWVNVLKTGNLLQQMAMIGYTVNTPQTQAAIDYIQNHWNDANQDPGWGKTGDVNYQAAFTLMKGFRSMGIQFIDTGSGPFSWYDEMADRIVNTQNSAGWWPADYWGDSILTTAWAILTLQKAVPEPAAPRRVAVGGSAVPANTLLILLPWMALAAIGAGTLLVLRRRRAQS